VITAEVPAIPTWVSKPGPAAAVAKGKVLLVLKLMLLLRVNGSIGCCRNRFLWQGQECVDGSSVSWSWMTAVKCGERRNNNL
jgi:hypothetical protein